EAIFDSAGEIANQQIGWLSLPGRRVDNLAHPRKFAVASLGDEIDRLAVHRQMARGMNKLRRKVLVDEKPVHGAFCRRSPVVSATAWWHAPSGRNRDGTERF